MIGLFTGNFKLAGGIPDSGGTNIGGAAFNGMGKHGIPDYNICCKGLFIGVEAKSGPDKKPTARQKLQLNQILAAGGVSMVIHSDNLHELEDLLAETVRGYA